MNLSKRSIDLIKNFSFMNPSLVFQPGNLLATVTPSKTVLARATIPETFDRPFAIYDLRKFLATISLLENPDFEFADTFVYIKSGMKKINYRFADLFLFEGKDKLNPYKKKEGILPSTDIEFAISYSDFESIRKAADVLRLPQVELSGIDGDIVIGASDAADSSSDKFLITVGKTNSVFNLIFRKENLHLIESETYNVKASEKGICLFQGADIEYYVACEKGSTFSAEV